MRRVLAALASLGLALGCGSPPPRAEEEPAPRRPRPDLSTPQSEERAGAEGAEAVATGVGLVTDPALRAYVQAVGAKLARNAPGFRYDYQFEIADQAAPNAFALPGGRIYVSRGALALIANEDELANVLGHEIAHVASRHAAAQEEVGGNAVMRTLQWQSLAAYSRDLESAADRLGQGLAAVSGYDPNGMATFLAALDGLDRLERGGSRAPGFLDSHPGTPGRAHDMAQRAGTIHWTRGVGVAANAAEYLRKLEGLALGEDAAQGVFDGQRFLHPGLAFTLRFPDGFETVNTPQAVGALAPDRRLQIVLELAEGKDPAAAAASWLRKAARGLAIASAAPVRVAGREAFRVSGRAGPSAVQSTFLPYRGHVFQLSCLGSEARRVDALCDVTTRSFRPLTPELLAKVTGLALALVAAREGETLAALGARSENAWSPAETAAWNALPPAAPLPGGAWVKTARRAAWQPAK